MNLCISGKRFANLLTFTSEVAPKAKMVRNKFCEDPKKSLLAQEFSSYVPSKTNVELSNV